MFYSKHYLLHIGIVIALLTSHCPYLNALHFLHLSFHKGCINDIAQVAQKVGFTVTSLFIPSLSDTEFDGYSSGNALYNIGHERAENIWNKHKDYFEQFDGIITSDTTPLSRILLQNDYQKPLIIWVCNRFDYTDTASLDTIFPDEEYYQLLRQAAYKKNIYIVPYTAFESFYAAQKNVLFGRPVIKPTGFYSAHDSSSFIPRHVNKSQTFFIPPYLNDIIIAREKRDIKAYQGKYNGPDDLKDFKGIIHIPYAWSNLAFFENISNGVPYFIPSYTFMLQLLASRHAWWADGHFFPTQYMLSEWYDSDNSDIITYFDSWDDLETKITTIDFDVLRKRIKLFAQERSAQMIERWHNIINDIRVQTK